MKARNIILSLLAAAVFLPSCSLKEDDSTFATSGNFYKNAQQCRAALNTCYIPMEDIYSYKMMLATECVTDLAYSRSSTQDAFLDISPANPRFGADVWKYGYQGVRYCNGTIAGIEGSSLDEGVKAPLVAEGKIMRAFYYWILTCFFGDVPFYTEDVADEATLAKVAKLPRMSADETRDWLIADLKSCLPSLSKVRSNEISDNRVGAAVGYVLLSKLAQWNKRWDVSLAACKEVESIYGSLDQYPLSDIPFRMKNTPESILEVQHTYSAAGLSYTSNVACLCMPYKRSGNKYDGVVIEELGDNATTYAPAQANGYTISTIYPLDETNPSATDKRRAMTIVQEWNGQEFNSINTKSLTAFFGPKFWCPNMQTNHDSNNYKIFRYADVVLMMAEAHCMLQDDMDEALRYLNMPKKRAGIREYARRDWKRIMEEIKVERGRELFGEFQRKFDLVRWGTWLEVTESQTRSSKIKENILPCHRYYPIPAVQVSYSGGAIDTNEYAQYGR